MAGAPKIPKPYKSPNKEGLSRKIAGAVTTKYSPLLSKKVIGNLEQYKYKDYREAIEKVFDKYFNRRSSGPQAPILRDIILREFFGLNVNDFKLLTPDEINDISIYFHYAFKRVASAILDTMSTDKGMELTMRIGLFEETPNLEQIIEAEVAEIFKGTAFHDLSHVTEFTSGVESADSVVPSFLKIKSRNYKLDATILKSEFYGHLYYETGMSNVIPTTMLLLRPGAFKIFKTNYDDAQSYSGKFEIVKTLFLELCTVLDRGYRDAEDYILAFKLAVLASSITQYLVDNPDAAVNDVGSLDMLVARLIQRDEKIDSQLRYIFEHRDNPRVLVDLFLRSNRAFIERLKQRREYGGPERFPDVKLEKDNDK